MSVAAVAVGWGGNLNEFLDNTFNFALPDSIALSRDEGGTANLPAVAIVVAVTFVPIRGVRETARANLIMVVIKLLVLAFFIVVAFSAAFDGGNLSPFAADGTVGVVDAAAIIFFAYIGFDAVSTGAEEAFMGTLRENARTALDGALASMAGVPATGELLEGDTVDELAALDDREIDLLVCGSRGYGPVRRVLLGGVSSRLIRRAACPVVVPRCGD